MRPLPRSFFARDADRVARDLLGALLVHDAAAGRTAGRIVETEAYFGPPGANPTLARRRAPWAAWVRRNGDPAAHSFPGLTQRNRIMFGAPGHAYVYLIYGINECLNVSTGEEGDPQAVLLRALEPAEGLAVMARRRGTDDAARLARGPGNLAKAMGVTRAHNGADMTKGPLWFARGERRAAVVAGPRVGVTKAADLPLRFWERGNGFVSGRRAG